MIGLKELREKTGYTQAEVAEEIGVSRSYYGSVENGHKSIFNFRLIRNMSNVLNIPLYLAIYLCQDIPRFRDFDNAVVMLCENELYHIYKRRSK